MRVRQPPSTRARILGAILIVACVGLAVVGGATFLVQRGRMLAAVDARLHAQVASLQAVAQTPDASVPSAPTATPVTGADAESDPAPDPASYASVSDYLRDAVARLVPAQNEGSVAVVDGVARYRPQAVGDIDISADTTLIQRAWTEAEKAKTAVMGTAHSPTGSLRYIAVPVSMPDDTTQGVYIRAVDLDAELSSLYASATVYAIAAVVVLAAIGVVGWFVAGHLLAPLRRLRDTADAITLTDLSARIPTDGDDDISDLTRTVNSMLDRLETSAQAQRHLLDDVRHELKTPITIVRGHLEIMDVHDAVDVQNTRDVGIRELDRMTRLVHDIDALAAAEGGEPYTMSEVEVSRLTTRLGDLVRVIPGHRWALDRVAHATVTADPDRLLQAWLQLADNAAKYAPAESAIAVGSTASDTHVFLWVRDHGPGIPPAVRTRIFRRFDRGGGRRSVGGSGLGLAIVDAIVKSHGGVCEITDTPGGGATFTMRLPRRGAHASLALPSTTAAPAPRATVPATATSRDVSPALPVPERPSPTRRKALP